MSENKPRSRKRSRKKTGATGLLLIFLAACIAVGTAGIVYYRHVCQNAAKSYDRFASEGSGSHENAADFGKLQADASDTDSSGDKNGGFGADRDNADNIDGNTYGKEDHNTDAAVGTDRIDGTALSRADAGIKSDNIKELSAEGWIPVEQADADTITLCFAGDILFDEHYAVMASMLQRSGGAPDINTAFDSELLSYMRGADIFTVNNEFPYSDRGEALKDKQFTFRAKPAYASLLKAMGADGVTLANNHVNDYGPDAMLDTLKTLEDIGMPYSGAGRNIEDAARPMYFTNGIVKIALLSVTQIERMSNPDTVGAGENSPGVFRCVSDAELNRLLDAVKKAKADGCFTAVLIHWGTEGSSTPDEWQLRQAKQIAEAGADLIVGNHPHVLQKIDYIGDVPVIYSLGNFLFNSKTQDTGLYTVSLDAATSQIKELKFIPALQSSCRTKAASGEEKSRILSELRELSPGVSIDNDGVAVKK